MFLNKCSVSAEVDVMISLVSSEQYLLESCVANII